MTNLRWALLAGILMWTGGLWADVWDDVATRMRAGDHRGALTLLDNAGEDDYQVHRVRGICLLELGELTRAEAELRSALALRPESAAARYYLAQVYALQGRISAAESFLNEVIDLAPGSSYAARAEHVLPGLQQLRQTVLVKDEPRRWDLYVRIAGERDDNVPARSRHEPQDDVESDRLVASVHAGIRLLDERVDEGWPTLRLGYSYYATFHDDELHEVSDVESHKGIVELSRSGRIAGRGAKLSLKGSYNETELGELPYSENTEADLTASLQVTKHVLAVLGYRMTWKDYENDTDTPEYYSRDGSEQEAKAGGYFYLFDNRLVLGLIYRYLENDVDGSQFALERHKVTGSVTWSLPAKLRLFASVTYANEDYLEYVPEPRRVDDAYTYYASLSRELWNEDWRIELNATHQTTDSNQMFAEYERTVYGAAVSWSP